MYNELLTYIHDKYIPDDKIETHILLMRLIRINKQDVKRYKYKLLRMIETVNGIEFILKTRLLSRY